MWTKVINFHCWILKIWTQFLILLSLVPFSFEGVDTCGANHWMMKRRWNWNSWQLPLTNFLVVLLQGCEILAGFRELSLLHALTHIPGKLNTSYLVSVVRNLSCYTYQWTNALFAYMRSNLWSKRAQASAMAVVLLSMQTHLGTLARSPPGTTVGGW